MGDVWERGPGLLLKVFIVELQKNPKTKHRWTQKCVLKEDIKWFVEAYEVD